MPRDDNSLVPDEPEKDDGKVTPEQIGDAARAAIMDALEILDRKGTPLAALLAMQATKRPDLLLKGLARFAPSRSLDDVKTTVQALHLAALRALAAAQPQPTLIDVTPTAPQPVAGNIVANDDWLR